MLFCSKRAKVIVISSSSIFFVSFTQLFFFILFFGEHLISVGRKAWLMLTRFHRCAEVHPVLQSGAQQLVGKAALALLHLLTSGMCVLQHLCWQFEPWLFELTQKGGAGCKRDGCNGCGSGVFRTRVRKKVKCLTSGLSLTCSEGCGFWWR